MSFPCLGEMEQWLGVFCHVTLVTQRISECAPVTGEVPEGKKTYFAGSQSSQFHMGPGEGLETAPGMGTCSAGILVSGQRDGPCGQMGRSLSESEATPDPKLSPFHAPSISGLVETAHLPLDPWHSDPRPAPVGCGVGKSWEKAPGPGCPCPGCTLLPWLRACLHSGQHLPVQEAL